MKRILVKNSNLNIFLAGEWVKFSPYKQKIEDKFEGKTKEFMVGSYITDNEKIIEAIKKTHYFISVEEFGADKEEPKELKKK